MQYNEYVLFLSETENMFCFDPKILILKQIPNQIKKYSIKQHKALPVFQV